MPALYSQRIRDAEGEPEVFVYGSFPEAFRNQFFHIVNRVLKSIDNLQKNARGYHGSLENIHVCKLIVEKLCEDFSMEKGLKNIPGNLYSGSNSIYALEMYCSNCSDTDFLDLMDFIFESFSANGSVCQLIQKLYKTDNLFYQAIDELNYRLKQHRLGYEFINGEIIKKTNTFAHESIVRPALKLLMDDEFRGAEDEYLMAYEHYRKGKNKDAILNAAKAFESIMKAICEGLQYTYDKDKDTASRLNAILESNGFYPSYLRNHITGILQTLNTGVPVLRNKTSGHGQGATVNEYPDEYVEYALNLVATNMIFLHRLYKSAKERLST